MTNFKSFSLEIAPLNFCNVLFRPNHSIMMPPLFIWDYFRLSWLMMRTTEHYRIPHKKNINQPFVKSKWYVCTHLRSGSTKIQKDAPIAADVAGNHTKSTIMWSLRYTIKGEHHKKCNQFRLCLESHTNAYTPHMIWLNRPRNESLRFLIYSADELPNSCVTLRIFRVSVCVYQVKQVAIKETTSECHCLPLFFNFHFKTTHSTKPKICNPSNFSSCSSYNSATPNRCCAIKCDASIWLIDMRKSKLF